MNTLNLLWKMVVRGCGWTTGIGALLGAGYGIVLLATTMLPQMQFNGQNGALPLIIVSVYGLILAALFGALVAGVIGFVAGPIGGALCAGMTRLFFTPLESERSYRRTAAIAGGLYGMFALIVAVRLISTSGFSFAPPIRTMTETLMLYVFPSLLGGAAGIYISQKIVNWYMMVLPDERSMTVEKPVEAPGHA